MSEICMTLLCPPVIEEKVLDVLLMLPNDAVFISTPTAAHGLPVSDLTQTEQVMGRARASAIQVILAASEEAFVLEHLREHFAGTGLRYWVTPVLNAGEIV